MVPGPSAFANKCTCGDGASDYASDCASNGGTHPNSFYFGPASYGTCCRTAGGSRPSGYTNGPHTSECTRGDAHEPAGGERPNYFPPPQKYRVTMAEEMDEALFVGDAATCVHQCSEQCADKYLSSIVCYVAQPATATPTTPKAIVPTDPATKPPSIPAPRNRREALTSPWWAGYYEAEQVEMRSHAKNGTWRLVPRSEVPAGCTVLRDRWAYSDKLGPDGNIERFKARLTAMGCFQRPGVDYTETYASVMATRTFRIMLQIYNSDDGYTMLHWDVSTAFVHAPLEERVYMRQASGHECKGKEDHVYLLVKALYGTKQAARAWQLHLRKLLVQAGCAPLQSDPATYVRRHGGDHLMIGTHVDDLFVLFNRGGTRLKDEVWRHLNKHLAIKDLGEASWTLQMSIKRDVAAGVLKLSQETFTLEVLRRFNMADCKPLPTPAVDAGDESTMMETDCPSTPDEQKAIADLPFLELIGCLWWLAQMTRPDIFVALQQASKWAAKPSAKLWRWLIRILK